MGAWANSFDRARRVVCTAVVCALGLQPSAAVADPPLRWTGDLDGTYALLGPLGTATRVEESWDGAFGAEVSLLRIREHKHVALAGLAFGGIRFAKREGGRLWLDALVATRRPLDLLTGLSLGGVAEVHEVIPPRWGFQAGVWVFAGVIPFARVGAMENVGVFVDVGLKIPLPAFRW